MKTRLMRMAHIMFVDDERNIDNGIIVTLKDGWFFNIDPGCGVRGFDTWSEALRECSKSNCHKAEK